VPVASPLIVVDVPLPGIVAPPGKRVNVHEPDGKPLNTTEPVATAHDGCVIVPTIGAVGVASCVLITTLPEATDVQLPLDTV
jgi:hypothetical protein